MSNKTIKDGEDTFFLFGTSTGETGQYGAGEIVEATHLDWDPVEKELANEPVHLVFTIENNEIIYFN